MRRVAIVIAILLVVAFAAALSPPRDGKVTKGWWKKNFDGKKGDWIKRFNKLRAQKKQEQEQETEAMSESFLSAGTVAATTGVNVRSGPCTTYAVATTLSAGQTASYDGSSPQSGCGLTWYRVTANGRTGFVAGSYLRQASSGSSTPSWGWNPSPAPVWNPAPAPTPSYGGSCALKRFTHSRIVGSSCLIDVQFESTMQRLVQYAEQCRVKIYITSSWRPNANVAGAIVTPATRSNHMAGHAIDFNLQSDSGAMCNSACLSAQNNPTFTCFTNKVKADSSMRWGISFNDPVHIDDGLNIKSTSTWDARYRATQQAKQSGCA